MLEEIRLKAAAEASKDSKRLDTLDRLVRSGAAGFGWDEIGGIFVGFSVMRPADWEKFGYFPRTNAVRVLLDGVATEDFAWGRQGRLYLTDCLQRQASGPKKGRKRRLSKQSKQARVRH